MNLLQAAQTVIAKQPFDLYQYQSRAKLPNGEYGSTFVGPTTLRECIQEVPKQIIKTLGLSLEVDHMIIYSVSNISTLQRGTSSSIVDWNGAYWQALDTNDWQAIDGWEGVIFSYISRNTEDFPGTVVAP